MTNPATTTLNASRIALDRAESPLGVDPESELTEFAEIIDTTTSATYAYHCEAAPGALTSAAVWRISRLTVATGVVQWADGDSGFNNIADNRATTQVYS